MYSSIYYLMLNYFRRFWQHITLKTKWLWTHTQIHMKHLLPDVGIVVAHIHTYTYVYVVLFVCEFCLIAYSTFSWIVGCLVWRLVSSLLGFSRSYALLLPIFIVVWFLCRTRLAASLLPLPTSFYIGAIKFRLACVLVALECSNKRS